MDMKKEKLYDITLCIYIICAIVTDMGAVAMKAARVLLVVVWGIKILSDKKIEHTPYLLRMIAFWLFATITILWAESKSYATEMSKSLLYNVVCMFALTGLIDWRKERIDLVLKTLILSPLLLELRVISIGGVFAYMNTRMVETISANTVGMCAAVAACLSLYYWMQGEKYKYGLLFVINTLIVILSASRKALIYEFLPIMIVFVFNVKATFAQRMVRGFSVLIAGGVGLWLMMRIPLLYELIGRRVAGLFTLLSGDVSGADGDSRARWFLIENGLAWIRQRPWLGYGIDNFRVLMHKHHPNWDIRYYAHNNYVELLVDTGIIGTALYYWNYVDMLAKGWRSRKTFENKELLIFGIFIALIVGEVALVSYFEKDVQVMLLLIWIILTEVDKKRMEKESLK